MTEIATIATTAVVATSVATYQAGAALCGLGLAGVVVADQRGGSWRGVDNGASTFASAKHVAPAAAIRLMTTVNAHAPQAMKRHMIRKNGTKGSSPWRVPV